MSKHVPVRSLPCPSATGSTPPPAPVRKSITEQSGAGESRLSEELTLHVRSLWGRLVLKVARVQRKENDQ